MAARIVKRHRQRDTWEKRKPEAERDTVKLERYRHKVAQIKSFLETAPKKTCPSGNEQKSNLTDRDSAKMSSSRGVIQGYNGLAVVDDRAQIVVHAGVVYSFMFDSFGTSHTTWSVSHVVDLEGDCPAAGERCIRSGALLEDNPRCRCVENVEDDRAGYVFCGDMP